MPKFSQIDPCAVRVDKVVVLKENKGTLVKLCNPDGSKLIFQSPPMAIAWNSMVRPQPTGFSCGVALSFASDDLRVKAFAKWLQDLHAHLAKLVQENSLEWYTKPLSEGQVADYLKPLVKDAVDSNFAPTFISKIAFEPDATGAQRMTVRVFDAAGNPLDPEETLHKDTRASVIAHIPYIHLGRANKQVSIRVDATQILAIPNINIERFAFEVDDDEELKAAATAATLKRASEEAHEDVPAAKRAVMKDFDDAEDV
ncbi:hypothetical protein JKP88DRAFT_241204 [Tribonema minus]|uniref:Uncharacterized protein n=1 Tax=Tribonema minus TaxID=303371 RepID=A0A835Z0R3_9STRA|nr:hypothetical protein JKP88DRAFT_241204 [Tribonema minus]